MTNDNCDKYVSVITEKSGTSGIVTFSEDGKIATKMINKFNKNIDNELDFSAIREVSFLKQYYSLPNIPNINLITEQEDKFTIEMNNCGLTLFDFINHTDFSTRMEHFDGIFKDVIIALINIHFNNILHGDIKSSNICYNPCIRKASLIDFGNTGIKTAGVYNKTLYTFDHLAPEIILTNKIDEKSEIWALGIVMVNYIHKTIITHRLVNINSKDFSKDLSLAYKRIYNNEKQWLVPDNLDLDSYPKLSKLIMDMLSFEPKDRPTLKEILKDYFNISATVTFVNQSINKDPNIFNECKLDRNIQIEKIFTVLKSMHSLNIFTYVVELLDNYININPSIGKKRYDIISASCIHIIINMIDQTNPISYKTIFNKFNLNFTVNEVNHFEIHICNILSYKTICNTLDQNYSTDIDYYRIKQIVLNYKNTCKGVNFLRQQYDLNNSRI